MFGTAQLSIDKTASSTEVGPGDTLVYPIQVGCSAISNVGCRDAITTDVILAPLEIVSVVPSGPNDAAAPAINGQNVRVDWTEDIGAGAVGMLDNTTSEVVTQGGRLVPGRAANAAPGHFRPVVVQCPASVSGGADQPQRHTPLLGGPQ